MATLRLTVAFVLSLVAVPGLRSEPAIRAFLVFCDAYPEGLGSINTSVTTDSFIVKGMLQDNIAEQAWGVSLEITEVNGASSTSTGVMESFERFASQVGPDDTVYVHFSGHGVIPDASNNEQFLQFIDLQSLSRAAWAEKIKALPAMLKVFVTDCCSSYQINELAEGPEEVNPWNSFYYLLRLHEGFVDITAASPGQDAFGTERGGFLTVNLCSDMQRYKTWEKVFQRTQARVHDETSAEIRGLENPSLQAQRPLAYSLGKPLFDEANADAKTPAAVKYIIPDSHQRRLGADELKPLSLHQLYFARNEIFARHGYDFSSPLLQYYFGDRFWYQKREGMKSPSLSGIEKENIALIAAEESAKGGPFVPHGNVVIIGFDQKENAALHAADNPDIFPYSSDQPLSRVAVQNLSLQELSIARNEIYARHGFPFKIRALQDHFANKPYYRRHEDDQEPPFSAIEKQNLWLIRKIERLKGGPFKWE